MAISTSTINVLLASFRYNKTTLLAFEKVCTCIHKEKSADNLNKQICMIIDTFVSSSLIQDCLYGDMLESIAFINHIYNCFKYKYIPTSSKCQLYYTKRHASQSKPFNISPWTYITHPVSQSQQTKRTIHHTGRRDRSAGVSNCSKTKLFM